MHVQAERDAAGLERALKLARRMSVESDDTLRAEVEHLADLCEERLEAVRAIDAKETPAAAATDEPCPGCGRLLPGNPVRCRYCGQVFV